MRDLNCLRLFDADFKEIIDTCKNEGDERFTFSIYITKKSMELEKVSAQPLCQYKVGRPKLEDEMINSTFSHTSSKSVIFFCGPERMGIDAEDIARRHNIFYHAETFEF